MMDVLDALLKIAAPEIRFEAYLAFEGEYSSTRKIRTNDCCSLLFVLEGGCDVVFEDDDAVWMSAGDFLLINNNDAYSVVSPVAEHQDQPSAAEKPDDIGKANRPSAGKILCASVVGGNGAVTAFFKLLPDRILLPSSAQSSASPVIRMVKTLHSEVIKKGGGANPIMESFLKCGLILALREMIQLNYSRCGLLSLCGHAMLNRYLCSIVEDPRRGWSLGASEASDHEFSEAEVIEVSGFSAATILSLMRVLISFPFLTASKKKPYCKLERWLVTTQPRSTAEYLPTALVVRLKTFACLASAPFLLAFYLASDLNHFFRWVGVCRKRSDAHSHLYWSHVPTIGQQIFGVG